MWNEVSCNPSYEKFLRDKEHKRFRRSLTRIGPLINNTKLNKPKILSKTTKKSRLQLESVQKIENSNQLLLKKMLDISKQPSSLNKLKVMPRVMTAGTLNLKNRMKAQNNIMIENKRILEKLQRTQSFYSAEK